MMHKKLLRRPLNNMDSSTLVSNNNKKRKLEKESTASLADSTSSR
jgi:hypothetical protein